VELAVSGDLDNPVSHPEMTVYEAMLLFADYYRPEALVLPSSKNLEC
jgi:hypothetical protein